ncbi:STAS/SEC14 domain-containing protein [Pontibacter liquoris]|uniref:STAS/SEC14 domain-containing protein n=1 Tax=Pontibacter liquoris TaxID=2905677 RepID=UPI001FA6CCBE|nr:STAS/SEC14 domain-containing protein [Pontibacter liquoris]
MKTHPIPSTYYCEFTELVAAWPASVSLTNVAGDTFVEFLKHYHSIEAKWHGHLTADDIVTAAKLYAKLLVKTPLRGLLNDKSEVTGDWSDANDWLEFEWAPQVVHLGLRCMAHVYSENMFSRLSARDLKQRVLPLLQMQNFDNRANAVTWLAQCLKTAKA